jgi:hypothetical protein
MPVTDQNQDHLKLAATFVVTEDIAPGSRLLAVASLPSGQRVILRDFEPQPFSLHGGPCPGAISSDRSDCSTATSYPLTGFGLPTASLPVGSQVEVLLRQNLTPGIVTTSHTSTRQFVGGISQAKDGTITIYGEFRPAQPLAVYIGLSARPFGRQSVSVSADRILVHPKKDPHTPNWMMDLYSVTVCQQNVGCDTLLARLSFLP